VQDGAGDAFEGIRTRVIDRPARMELPGVGLVVIDGVDRGRSVRLAHGVARIGSAPSSTLQLGDPTVSRLHCEVAVRDRIMIRDCGSTNGTFVDGVRVLEAQLTAGAMLRVGATTLRVDLLDEPGFVELSARSSFGELIGASPEMRGVYAVLEKVAGSDATVLIEGETGTGKELAARALHDASGRAAGPFIAVDCGAIPENLIESELFGHVRGAFTGASADRRGAFEEAHGGTLFFDEIGELPLGLQPKLLRALETREVRRVGASRAHPVDVRVVAATNRSLARSVNTGTFREDLYYRLAVIEIEMPPLRARREDIPALARHFHERFSGSSDALPEGLANALCQRAWPGNVRELRNFVQRAVSLGWQPPAEPADAGGAGSRPLPDPQALVPLELPLKEARLAWMEQFESVYVRALLEKTGGNVTRAAALAGVNRRFLQRLMARLGIRSRDDAEEA
jgi:transcriptional regulator with GAF, ATPase, and Fis domain